MMRILANLKIGKKLALLLSSGIGTIVGLGCLGLWALNATRDTVGQEQFEAEKMLSAQRVASGLGRVNSVVAHITFSRHCDNCHGGSNGGSQANEAALAKECTALLTDLKARESTSEGGKLVAVLAEASTHWLDSNDRAAREMADGSEQVRASAGQLSTVAEHLQATVARFHV
jgi:hypothetical protein